MFVRPVINCIDFARNGNELRGEIRVAELPRVMDLVTNQDGVISYHLQGFPEEGRDMLALTLHGHLRLCCQRCLEEMLYPIEIATRFRLLPDEELEKDESDEFDCIAADPHMDVLALLEDEVLLCIPFAPKHPVGQCFAPQGHEKQAVSPFSVLAKSTLGK